MYFKPESNKAVFTILDAYIRYNNVKTWCTCKRKYSKYICATWVVVIEQKRKYNNNKQLWLLESNIVGNCFQQFISYSKICYVTGGFIDSFVNKRRRLKHKVILLFHNYTFYNKFLKCTYNYNSHA